MADVIGGGAGATDKEHRLARPARGELGRGRQPPMTSSHPSRLTIFNIDSQQRCQMSNYELIEHTADIGIRVKGKDLKELFTNAALAMFALLADENTCKKNLPTEIFLIKQEAADLEELFINWLNELLSLSSAEGKIFSKFKFKILDKNTLEAEASGSRIEGYKVKTEIKAATYHALKLEQAKTGWQAEVIFDV